MCGAEKKTGGKERQKVGERRVGWVIVSGTKSGGVKIRCYRREKGENVGGCWSCGLRGGEVVRRKEWYSESSGKCLRDEK